MSRSTTFSSKCTRLGQAVWQRLVGEAKLNVAGLIEESPQTRSYDRGLQGGAKRHWNYYHEGVHASADTSKGGQVGDEAFAAAHFQVCSHHSFTL
jgi:hypothetical protein